MEKLKNLVCKLISSLLILTLVFIPLTSKVDAAEATKTKSVPIYCYSIYAGNKITVYTKMNTSSKYKQGVIIPSDYLKITAVGSSGWVKVTYPTKTGKKTGYCLSKGIFMNINFSDKSGYLDGTRQTVYKKYDLKSKLGTISGDTPVKITGIHKNGNTQILYKKSGGGYYLGWIKGKWSISSTKPSTKSVKLSVPKYSQYDSRWKNAKLGKSSKTIGQVGCTTTCISMSESCLTQNTIYPNAISKKLSYTSGGALYWSSSKYTTSSPSNYLYEIYNQLKQGKPVLVGAKTKSGSQHWIVVTGYNGKGVNKASNYYINDPGYKTKTNLQHHFNKYTKFYKIAYKK